MVTTTYSRFAELQINLPTAEATKAPERVDQVAVLHHMRERFAGFDVMEGVGSLVDKSLVRQQDEANGKSRLLMLETIREFATARLDEDSAFSAPARRAHATFFAEFTASQWSNLTGENREQALTALAVELENIRTAWRFWANEGNLEQLNQFTDSLSVLYDARGWYHATVAMTTDLLTILSNTVSTPDRARQEILLQTSLARALLAIKGYSEEVERAYARALELCSSAGEIPQLFPVLRGLASFYVLRSEFAKGFQIGERILQRLGGCLPALPAVRRQASKELLRACLARRDLHSQAFELRIRQGKLDQLENAMQSGASHGMRIMDSAIKELFDKGVISGRSAYEKANNKQAFEQFKDVLGLTPEENARKIIEYLEDQGFLPC